MSKTPRPVRIAGDVAYVPLTKGYEAIIDAADVPVVEAWCWYASVHKRANGDIKAVYAARMGTQNGARVMVLMHRVLCPGGKETDHRDGNGLNNRRNNMRPATHAENQYNQCLRANSRSGVKGVSWHAGAQKWIAQIRANGPTKYLGLYESVDEARAVVEAARKDLHGAFARRA